MASDCIGYAPFGKVIEEEGVTDYFFCERIALANKCEDGSVKVSEFRSAERYGREWIRDDGQKFSFEAVYDLFDKAVQVKAWFLGKVVKDWNSGNKDYING